MTTDQTNMTPDDPTPAEGEQPVSLGGERDVEGEYLAQAKAHLAQAQGEYQRVLADFSNYQRRALQNEQVAKVEGASRVAGDVVTVIDHFDLALAQDLSSATPESLVAGMKLVRDELIKTLAKHGITLIAPKKNDEFTPGRHEAIMQQADASVEPGRVVSVFQPGYLITSGGGERVIRPAKVAVAPTS